MIKEVSSNGTCNGTRFIYADMADSIYVINVGGYFVESTKSEIEYARAHGKRIDYLEPAE